MNKYIDAEWLKAEIERHIKEVKEAENRFHPNLGFFDAKLSGIYDILSIIDSLQAEQVYVLEGIARTDDYEVWVNLRNTDIKDGDEVIIQIRKK